MIWMMKRLFVVTSLICVILGLFSIEASAEKKIGVLLWSEEPRYIEAKNGMMEQLSKDGFGEPKVKFTIENARGNRAKADDLAQKFAAMKMDMIIAIGTSAAVPVAKEIKDVPIVFGMVYDPVESKISQGWKSSGNNTTGASSKAPMSQIMSSLKQLVPVKKIAVLYTSGEKNSEAQLKEVQAVQNSLQIKVLPVPLGKKEEVAQVLPEVLGAVDAMYITGSNIVGESVPTIVDMATKARVITVTHLDDLVNKGVLLGVCADAYAIGRLAGEKATKVLKGTKPSSIPIEPLKKLDVIVNMKTVKAGQIKIPPDFMKMVTKTVE